MGFPMKKHHHNLMWYHVVSTVQEMGYFPRKIIPEDHHWQQWWQIPLRGEGSMIPTKCQGGCPQLAAVFPKKTLKKIWPRKSKSCSFFSAKKKRCVRSQRFDHFDFKKRDRRSNAPAGLTVSLKKNVNPHYTPIIHHWSLLTIDDRTATYNFPEKYWRFEDMYTPSNIGNFCAAKLSQQSLQDCGVSAEKKSDQKLIVLKIMFDFQYPLASSKLIWKIQPFIHL